MTDAGTREDVNPVEAFLSDTRTELEQVRREAKEISLLVEQSKGEVDKLAQRHATVAAQLHQLQGHFDTVPREDIRSTYEAAQDVQQRLFTMRGQLEKLESDQVNLQRFGDFLARTLQLLEGRPAHEVDNIDSSPTSVIVVQIIEAQEEERRKISRQIHDGPAQALSNFILQTEIALRLFDTDQDRAREEMNNLKTAASSTFSKVRDFIFDLRPMMLDDLGLIPTVRRYVEAYKDKSGMNIGLVLTGSERRMASHREVLIFRTIQMLLGNAREHAQATQLKISLDVGDRQARVMVEDNGRGFDAEHVMEEMEGHSLPTLRDRLALVGGDFELDSRPGEGTRITFTLPVED